MAALWQQLQGIVGLWLGAALAVALLSGGLRSARFKGWLGEYKVRRWLVRDLDAQHYHCAHNITLRLADGSTTQIDHVVVSPYGMFVLETKHLQGWIFGSEKQPTWTQTIYRHRSSFQNPLRQNWRHIKALQELLQVPLAQLHSVVVFTGTCSFKTAMPRCVTQGRDCIGFIKSHTEVVWTVTQVAQYVQALSQQRLQATRATHQAHVAQLQTRHAVKPVPMAARVTQRAALRQPPVPPHIDPPQEPVACAEPSQHNEVSALGSGAPPRQACPDCGDTVVRRSLPHSDGSTRYFCRCVRFPLCRFMEAQAVAEV